MVRLCRSGWIIPPQNDACANTEIVLTAAGAEQAAGKIGHQVIRLNEAPCQILGEHHVHAAADGHGKRALRFIAGDLAAAVCRPEQNFAEGDKVIEAPQVQARAEQVGLHVSTEGRRCFRIGRRVQNKNLAVETIAADLADDPQPLVRVIGERACRAQLIEIAERAGAEVDVAEHARHFESGGQLAPGVAVPGIVGPIRKDIGRFGRWRRHREEVRRSRSDAEITGRDGVCGLRRFAGGCRARVFLLRTDWQGHQNAHCRDCTPFAHCILHERNYESLEFLAASVDRPQRTRWMATQARTQQTTCFSRLGAVSHQSCK